MKLYRYMSVNEYSLLARGETLTNTTDHSSTRGMASTAKGFSFGIGDPSRQKRTYAGCVELSVLKDFWCSSQRTFLSSRCARVGMLITKR